MDCDPGTSKYRDETAPDDIPDSPIVAMFRRFVQVDLQQGKRLNAMSGKQVMNGDKRQHLDNGEEPRGTWRARVPRDFWDGT